MFALRHHILIGLFMALALVAPTQANEAEELRKYVDTNTQRLVDKLNEERGLFERDPTPICWPRRCCRRAGR